MRAARSDIPPHLTIRALVAKLKRARRACTLLGVGPVSEVVVRAAFQACLKHNCPPLFIASRNQVDLKALGHGYLMGGMDQQAFVRFLQSIGTTTGYRGNIYICRDHGGPWQRNAELNEKYPVELAMAIARRSFREDVAAGFNYLHVDPTKCPFPYTQDQLVRRTVDLIAYCERVRKQYRRPAIDYEVGTEDIQGGLTTPRVYESFLKKLTSTLAKRRLPAPTCVVGQTGTLCKLDRNVGRFDAKGTARLVKIAAKYGLGFKEHNSDYLPQAACRRHPRLGVTAMNVAPEFGLVETDALLALADREAKLVRKGSLPAKNASRLKQLFLDKTFRNAPWQKWLTDDLKRLPPERIQANTKLRLLIARVCGHYTYDDPEIKSARRRLSANLDRCGALKGRADSAEECVIRKVRGAIEFYIRHLALAHINALLAE